jgi:arginyl-tRNA synthetase
MTAYAVFGEGATPRSAGMKPDQFVGEFYVRFGVEAEKDPSLEEKAQEMLLAWEAGDAATMKLWKKMNGWVYEGMQETLEKMNEDRFKKKYYESEYYDKAAALVEAHVGNGVITKKSDGLIVADFGEDSSIPEKVLLRPDGTSVYITADLYLAQLKDKEGVDQSIIVSADEQDLHFKQLFVLLKSLGVEGDHRHLSYGMMRRPEGKIKSREGFGKALADALIAEVEGLARTEVAKRHPEMKEKKLSRIANEIMQAAIKFYILNVDAAKVMIFDPQEAVSFTGKTGPYIQYTVVRLNSILAEKKPGKNVEYGLLEHPLEVDLLNTLKKYPEILQAAREQYNPSILTHYIYELAQKSNHLYHEVPVLKAPEGVVQARVALIDAIARVLTDGLAVCNIPVPEKM